MSWDGECVNNHEFRRLAQIPARCPRCNSEISYAVMSEDECVMRGKWPQQKAYNSNGERMRKHNRP